MATSSFSPSSSIRVGRAALFALAVGVVLVFGAAACVDKNPIITGNRTDAGVDARPPAVVVVPQSDDPDEDAPDCRYCAETLSTDTARGTLCRKNGDPSSVRRLNALVDCLCYDKCVQECGSYCAGSKTTDECQICLFAGCIEQINACTADKRP
jgi:hypothetical protein